MKRLFVLVLAAALAGCRPAGGISLDDVWMKMYDPWPVEGTAILKWESYDASTAERQSFELQLTSYRIADPLHYELEAVVRSPQRSVPFRIIADGGKIALEAEGLNKPIVRQLDEEEVRAISQTWSSGANSDLRTLYERMRRFVVRNVPNPKSLHVSPVVETVLGESTQLYRIRTSISDDEIPDLLVEFLDNLIQDREEFKSLVLQVYKTAQEHEELAERLPEEAMPTEEELEKFFVEFKAVAASLKARLEEPSVRKEWFGAIDGRLAFDLYVDASLDLRKLSASLEASQEEEGSFRLSVELEQRKATASEQPATFPDTAEAVEPDDLATTADWLRLVDRDSDLFAMLRDDFKLSRKKIEIRTSSFEAGPPGAVPRPFIDPETGRLMLPVRYVSERLDCEVQWEPPDTVTVVDPWTDKTIRMRIGTREATVDGRPVAMGVPAVRFQGSVYVPARFLAEQLGASVEWNGSSATVNIIRK